MQGEESQTVILYRQGEQDYITFGNNEPIEVRVVEGLPIEIVVKIEQEENQAQPLPIVVQSDDSTVDSIDYAAQIGRLDFVAFALTILGLIIGAAALAGFMQVSTLVKATARDATVEFAPKEAKRVAEKFINDHGNAVVEKQFSAFLGSHAAGSLISDLLKSPEMIALIAAQIEVTELDKTGEVMAAKVFDLSETTVLKDLSGIKPTEPGKFTDQDG